jgi:hypothetical protein
MSLFMKLTHNSLSTMIAWVSTCLLFSGISTLFSESARMVWMSWGCFGLASAVGLDAVAQVRERMRVAHLNRVAVDRFERELTVDAEANKAHLAIRETVNRLLGELPSTSQKPFGRGSLPRYSCNLATELVLLGNASGGVGRPGSTRQFCRVTNLSELGFEITVAERVPPQRLRMTISAANGERVTMLGDVLWCEPQCDGVILAGGRFNDVVSS